MSNFHLQAEHLSNLLLEESVAFVPGEAALEPIIAEGIFALPGLHRHGTGLHDGQSAKHSRKQLQRMSLQEWYG